MLHLHLRLTLDCSVFQQKIHHTKEVMIAFQGSLNSSQVCFVTLMWHEGVNNPLRTKWNLSGSLFCTNLVCLNMTRMTENPHYLYYFFSDRTRVMQTKTQGNDWCNLDLKTTARGQQGERDLVLKFSNSLITRASCIIWLLPSAPFSKLVQHLTNVHVLKVKKKINNKIWA